MKYNSYYDLIDTSVKIQLALALITILDEES